MKVRNRFLDWATLTPETQYAVASTAPGRARRLEPVLRAFISIENQPAVPSRHGALARLPYAAKDLFFTTAHGPKCGLADPIDFAPITADAAVLRQLDDAGAIRIGFTAMTELAYEPSGYNAVCPSPRNPWNPDFIPGGSSSGSAVAVASGNVVSAFGSDTGGSLRIPAHCCGVTSWKPTYGAVSDEGAVPLAPTLDVIGLLARSAADLLPSVLVLIGQSSSKKSSPIRRMVVFSDALNAAEPSVRRVCQQGIETIAALDIAVTQTAGLPAIEPIDVHALNVMQAEAARTHAARLEHPAISPVIRKRLAKGLGIDNAALQASRAARAQLATEFLDQVLGKADAAVLPVMPIRTPLLTETDPASPSFSARQLYQLSAYCRFVNFLGFPAVAVPTGFDDRSLPVALQIIGRPGSDLDLLAVAADMQRTTDWHARIPDGIADAVSRVGGAFA